MTLYQSSEGGSIIVRTAITLRPGLDDELIEALVKARPRTIAALIRDLAKAGIEARDAQEDASESNEDRHIINYPHA